MPSVFLSHGAPTLAIEAGAAHEYLKIASADFARPEAIIVISAHHIRSGPGVTIDAKPQTIYDFSGFPEALYQISYAAPGAPKLARRIIDDLKWAGFSAYAEQNRGLDHGAWIPLHLMYPDADIPVVQVSIDVSKSPQWHYDLGRTLAPLRREGMLIIGSGGATHNLREFFKGGYSLDAESPEWVTTFADWLSDRIGEGDVSAVLEAVEAGPDGHKNHPTMDHILPLFVAMGAGGEKAKGVQIHKSTTYGVLSMDAYSFDEK
jgi:4,5-DOPA dioxygenase extradiol